jgi:(p)ppGpp synthase/HD superfamily hydrolase
MSTTSRVQVAERLAEYAFAGRTRLNDDTLIEHSRRVANRIPAEDEHGRIVAYLHDVLEDTGLDASVIHHMFGPEVYADVWALTRDEGTTYDEYMERLILSGSRTAVAVKLADFADNLNGAPPSLRRRYMKAMSNLINRRVLAPPPARERERQPEPTPAA